MKQSSDMTLEEYLEDINPELLTISEGRRELTKFDPMLFALIYLPHHLKNANDELTLSEFHWALAEYGKTWINKPTYFAGCFAGSIF